jgi:hypothetical protein
MDWELVVNIISEAVKDDGLREEIYRKLIEESEDFDGAEECIGSDDVFDRVYEELYDEYDGKEDLYEDDGDDFGYEDE